jgi:hypothetical protein
MNVRPIPVRQRYLPWPTTAGNWPCKFDCEQVDCRARERTSLLRQCAEVLCDEHLKQVQRQARKGAPSVIFSLAALSLQSSET